MAASQIYLIEAENGLVKIGRAVVVRDRVTAVRTHSPVLVRLIAVWLGGEKEEAELHQRFASLRRHGEWFAVEGELAGFVEDARGTNVDDIPTWEELGFGGRAAFVRRRADVARAAARFARAERPDAGTAA